jgi:hypothetical protein
LTHSSAMPRQLATIDKKPRLRSRSPSRLKNRSEKRSARSAPPRSRPASLHGPGGSGVSDPATKKDTLARRRRRHCSRVRWPRFSSLACGPHPSRQWLRNRFFAAGPLLKNVRRDVRRRDRGQRPTATEEKRKAVNHKYHIYHNDETINGFLKQVFFGLFVSFVVSISF